MKRSPEDNQKGVVGILADNHAASTITGAGIDCQGFEVAGIYVNSGINGSSGTVDITIEQSDDNGVADAFAAVTGAVFAQITEATDNTIYNASLDLQARKRFIRVVAVVGTAACDFGVVVVLGEPQSAPPSQVNTTSFSLVV